LTASDSEPSKWPELYRLKLLYCHKAADFDADPKKHPEQVEFRDKKREILIELIDVLDDGLAFDYLLTEDTLQHAMVMIERNIFRTFTNKSK
jgi:hypothetical protein